VYRSTNRAGSWVASASGITHPNVQVIAVSPGFAVDRTAFAGTSDGGLFRSTNGGESWQRMDSYPTSGVKTIAFAPDYAASGIVYAGYTRVYVSTDRGITWSELAPLQWQRYNTALLAPPGSPRVVFAGTDGQSLWRYVSP